MIGVRVSHPIFARFGAWMSPRMDPGGAARAPQPPRRFGRPGARGRRRQRLNFAHYPVGLAAGLDSVPTCRV
jgi:hypothetical protein